MTDLLTNPEAASEFEQEVAAAIARHSMIGDGGCGKVGVALSGGADSVALLAVMVRLGYRVVALHCNFHLRGDESRRDRDHAFECARRLSSEWAETDFDVEAFRRLNPGTSVEMACRELRYNWFERMAGELGLDRIAIGHNRNDRVETFLLNSLRSAGLRGLTSMAPVRGIFIRPLLEQRRDAVEAYLAAIGLGFVTDSSNLSECYARNKVRLGVVASLEERFSGAVDRIALSVSNLESTRQLYEQLVAERAARYLDPTGQSIDLLSLLKNEKHPRQLLFEMLRDHGINPSQVDSIIASAGQSGLTFGDCRLSRGRLYLNAVRSHDAALLRGGVPVLEAACELTVVGREEFKPQRDDRMTAWFDAALLDGDPEFEIRQWRLADRMRPFGMRGSRLLSDIFNDAKLTPAEKESQPVVTRNGTIIWLPGLRASASFPVRPDSTGILRLSWRKPGGKP